MWKIPESAHEKSKKFKLKTEKDDVAITMKITCKINVIMVQFGVNLNKGSIGHKL